ncbi:hypothetical protein M8523_06910 [Hyphomicrobiales bacterium BP6-180914]|uniref:AMP-binding enzyme C-terminal domain-containing protein n=2 Tax=Lichenifustis flavocetrariae TaxID=2949735 RepID=A0AA41YV34_9HYPH|nr:hypothetical protein [Lichenifustis flavocetrariae]
MIGLPHPEWGEIVVAGILLGPDANFDPDELRTAFRGHIASFQVPRRFMRLHALPRNQTGKVLKGEPRALVAGRANDA